MAQRTYTTRLLEKVPRVGDIVSFSWERPAGYDYQPGQWFVITFPRLAEPARFRAAGRPWASDPASGSVRPTATHSLADEPYTHHFSHSNSPLDPVIEFTTRLRGSEFKNALDTLQSGAEVEIEGPYGSFNLPADVERAAFLTGGIGITCVRSILRWLAQSSGRGVKQVALIFANRSEQGIPFREELTDLSDRIPQLRVVHVLSRPEESWQGYRGHIDQEILTRELPEPHIWSYYLSGPPSLVQSMRELLLGWGIHSEAITTERFEGYE